MAPVGAGAVAGSTRNDLLCEAVADESAAARGSSAAVPASFGTCQSWPVAFISTTL